MANGLYLSMAVEYWFLIGTVIIVAIPVAIYQINLLGQRSEVEQLYRRAVDNLRRNPKDASARSTAQRLGAKYADLLARTTSSDPQGKEISKNVVMSEIQAILDVDHYGDLDSTYKGLLKKLKAAPNDPDLRTAALDKGRELSAFGRKLQGAGHSVTVFDEIAIMNDINAAAASSGRIAASVDSNPAAAKGSSTQHNALTCPHCQRSQEGDLDISPSGDLKCEGCGKWFNIRG